MLPDEVVCRGKHTEGRDSLLRQRGEDVAAIAEFSPGIHDEQVIGLARDQQRILLSFDRDQGG